MSSTRRRRAALRLDTDQPANPTALEREQRRILNRKARCGFPRTQELIAKVLQAGTRRRPSLGALCLRQDPSGASRGPDRHRPGAADRRVGPGDRQVHQHEQPAADLDERDRHSLRSLCPQGIAIHDSTKNFDWSDDPASMLQWKFWLAESTFNDAANQLKRLARAAQRRNSTRWSSASKVPSITGNG